MGKMAVIFKVYPKEGEIDKVMSRIKEKLNPQGIQISDIAFGLKLIKVMFVFEDVDNSSASIETKLKDIEGVNEVEVEDETLI
ncbi:MAG: hypothetical protein ACP5RI_02820 [Candidatus Micrarchaeia archaeon]